MEYLHYYNDYKDKVFTYFYYNLSRNKEQAEDLTSDTFLKAFEKFDLYNDAFAFSTWIFTIAKNTLFDYYKKQKYNIEIDELTEINHKEFLAYEINFWENVDNKEKLIDFWKAISKLDVAQKEIIVMKYINDFSNKEISQQTWKTEANVRKIASRWMKRVKEIMWVGS